MKISEAAKQQLVESGIMESAVELVESICDRERHWVCDPEHGLYYMHAPIGRTTIWLEYTQDEEGQRYLQRAHSHRMSIRDEYAGKNVEYQEGPTPEVPYCVSCNTALEMQRIGLNYLLYPFAVTAPRCPVCGQVFFTPHIMETKIVPVEINLEDK